MLRYPAEAVLKRLKGNSLPNMSAIRRARYSHSMRQHGGQLRHNLVGHRKRIAPEFWRQFFPDLSIEDQQAVNYPLPLTDQFWF